jgi:hypothetical protein
MVRSLSKQRLRRALQVLSVFILLLLLGDCATAPSSRKYVGLAFGSKTSDQIEESFQALWERWTVHFGQATRGGKSIRLSSPFTMIGGRAGGRSEFPLQITATLMDSLLIEAGLQHYAILLTMTPDEQAEFRRAYYNRYDPTNHLLIWCELHTTWAELHLDCDRWNIFIEDDAGNQYEPVQILEEPRTIHQIVTDRSPGFQPEQGRWEFHQKTVMFCFPKQDFSRNPILSDGVQFLKVVFQSNEEPKTRAEGIWVFEK